jgi:hypothetical protein
MCGGLGNYQHLPTEAEEMTCPVTGSFTEAYSDD